jgi:hypothetical protein
VGAWGTGSFENDDALDWVDDLEECDDTATVRNALTTVTEWPQADTLEAIDCCVALAAAEMVAAALGHPSTDFPEEAEDWLDRKGPDLGNQELQLARVAVERIRKNSELREIWAESDALDEWLDVLKDLELRLS